jgi:THO complex subunit 2
MKDFSLSKLPPLLGFKMKETGTDGHPMVSNALIQVMVMLATEQLLDLRHLTPYFAIPVDGMLQEAAQFFRQQELERIKSIGRVRLGDAGGGQQQQQGDVKKNQDKKHLHDLVTQLQQHVLIRLLQALLERGEWDLAKTTLPSMQAWSDVCMLMPKPFAVLLCDLVQQWIQPVYLQCVTTPQLLAVSTVEQAPTTTTIPNDLLLPPSASLEQVLQAISEPLLCTVDTRCIAQRPLLYCQLCRLMRQLLLKQKEDSGAAAAALSDDSFLPAEAYHFLNSFLVPSLSLLSPSPSLSTELWLVLSELPYPTRYRLYRDWQMGSADKKPLCFVESDIAANKEARYHLKRLSKDNVRDMGRQLSKVTHSSPLVVFSVILSQVESYDNLIQMMVEAVRFVTPLGLDVLSYCILSRLSDNNNNNNNTTATPGVNRNRLKGMNTQFNKNIFFYKGGSLLDTRPKRVPEYFVM